MSLQRIQLDCYGHQNGDELQSVLVSPPRTFLSAPMYAPPLPRDPFVIVAIGQEAQSLVGASVARSQKEDITQTFENVGSDAVILRCDDSDRGASIVENFLISLSPRAVLVVLSGSGIATVEPLSCVGIEPAPGVATLPTPKLMKGVAATAMSIAAAVRSPALALHCSSSFAAVGTPLYTALLSAVEVTYKGVPTWFVDRTLFERHLAVHCMHEVKQARSLTDLIPAMFS
jgi:hypothetical protein